MKPLIFKIRKHVLLDATFWMLCVQGVNPSSLFGADLTEIAAADMKIKETEESYTINFQNVSMLEYIKFVSKIAGLNFIFDENDLKFNVTIVSEEPITVKNIMSTMIQVLRIHDLTLLEQDNNLVISRSITVNQISTIVSSDVPESDRNAPIVTRIFRLKNASPNSVAAIIRPMTSAAAIIEVSVETRQLIVTDVTTNVDKISTLLTSLDAPHTSLEIDSYIVKHIAPEDLIQLVTQIVQPFAESNPLILVPQLDTNTIFIVSTPYLIDRSLAVMTDLDIPSRYKVGDRTTGPAEVFLYKIQYHTWDSLHAALKKVAHDLKESSNPPQRLIQAIETVKWIPESNSLLFTTDADTVTKIKNILANLDGEKPLAASETVFIYKTKKEYKDRVERFLGQIVTNMSASRPTNEDLIACLKKAKWISESQSFLFQGSPESITTVKELLNNFEIQENLSSSGKQAFFVYELKKTSGAFIIESLKNLAKQLDSAQPSDVDLIQALRSAKWLQENNSILITGSESAVAQVKSLVTQFDQEGPSGSSVGYGKQTFMIYKIKNIPAEKLIELLKNVASNIKTNDPAAQELKSTIQNMKYMKDTNALFFTGYDKTLQEINSLIQTFDISSSEAGSTFSMYSLKNVAGDKIVSELRRVANRLKGTPNPSMPLIRALENVTWEEDHNALLITGTPEVLDQVKALIAQFDVPGSGKTAGEKTSFFIYKPQNRSAKEIESALKEMQRDFKSSGLVDPDLIEALASMQYVPASGSLLFTGTPEALEKVKELLNKADLGGAKAENVTFLIYEIRTSSPTLLIDSLKIVAKDLEKSNLTDKEIAKAINGVKYIKESNSLLFTGTPDVLHRIETLLQQFDKAGATLPSAGSGMEQHAMNQIAQTMREVVSQFALYKPQYVSGEQLIMIFQDFKKNLLDTNVLNKPLFDAIDNLRWIPKTSSLLISGDAASITQIEELLKKFDVPSVGHRENPEDAFMEATNFLVYKLQYQKGDEIQSAIKKIGDSLISVEGKSKDPLADAINSLQWIEVTNSLLTSGDPESLQKIKHLIENLDIPLKQVLIEVLVIETTLINSQSFGLEWIGNAQYKNRLSSSISNIPTTSPNPFVSGFQQVNPLSGPSPSNIPILSGFDLGVIGNMLFHKGQSFATLASLVNALQTDSDSTIVMNPKIVTQDNKSATIFVGRNIPFVGSVVTSTVAEIVTSSSLEYRNIGVSLTITPVLGDSEMITLDINNEISSAPGEIPQTTAGSINGIITTQTNMNTRVHVPNDHFLVLSGMINDTQDHSKVGVPCLGGLPIVGALFSTNTRNYSKSNVIFFIRPHIINSYDDYKKVTEFQENLFKDVLPQRNLKESFDAGIDLLKTYKDE